MLGIDVGSTTVKLVVLSSQLEVLFSSYRRHYSKVKETVKEGLKEIEERFKGETFRICITGSAGLGLAERSHLPFLQEVVASFKAIEERYPDTDVAIELGGEDAKIIFVTGGVEERMNGQCAGGTGAFIDQMATLLDVNLTQLDEMSLTAERHFPIASRCGVFAKSDIQSLLNQGAKKEEIALSIYYAVADQTVAGLSQGRPITGKALFLGGPLYFLKGLKMAFKDVLSLKEEDAYFPKDADIFVAYGAALGAKDEKEMSLEEIISHLEKADNTVILKQGEPLFKNEEEYKEFLKDHEDFALSYGDISSYKGNAYLGIDEGSTTTKIVLIGEHDEILYSHYESNKGLPIEGIVKELKHIYEIASPEMKIVSSAATGYGEDLIKSSLRVEHGLVETVAHFKAAKHFCPDVTFVIDIGGQDIKCFKIHNGAIDSIMLNEACSSGCGSFLQTFASALGYSIEEFANKGLFAKHPVELGSRCTVFMNSSVKEAQREGASIEDISAGLSLSVVKNALYKVVRIHNKEELGKKIVCQGGTFLNNAVLRSFEREVGIEAIRPSISGLMGAYGAALYAKEKGGEGKLLTLEELNRFSYKSFSSVCKGCTSHCALTILSFAHGGSFLSGNKCGKPDGRLTKENALDMYHQKRKLLSQRVEVTSSLHGKVGLPLSLVNYEQLPFWENFFAKLNFEPVVSPFSTRELYRAGQKSIPSDTACYPAKLMHGHIDHLLNKGVDFIFYPSETYNINEKRGDNHFNCPVVAYYGELLKKNDARLKDTPLLDPFIELEVKDKTISTLFVTLSPYGVTKKEIKEAYEYGKEKFLAYKQEVYKQGEKVLTEARKQGKKIILLLGRPYHIDPEVSHGLDKLLDTLKVAVLSEDSIPFGFHKEKRRVLNQWTYHARLYDAASWATTQKDVEVVQLVSFGCGVDAVTSDEVRRIVEEKGRLYTQIKIDEINNLGAIRIRLRSLLSAVEE